MAFSRSDSAHGAMRKLTTECSWEQMHIKECFPASPFGPMQSYFKKSMLMVRCRLQGLRERTLVGGDEGDGGQEHRRDEVAGADAAADEAVQDLDAVVDGLLQQAHPPAERRQHVDALPPRRLAVL